MYRVIAILLILCFCSSCSGFKPVYGDGHNGGDELLSAIRLERVQSKESYKLHNYLEDAFGDSLHQEKLYSLDLNVTGQLTDLLVQQDSTIVKKQHNVSAQYVLHDLKTKAIIDSGNIVISVSFGEYDSAYATYAIERRTYDNALKELTLDLKKRLIVALERWHQKHEDYPR